MKFLSVVLVTDGQDTLNICVKQSSRTVYYRKAAKGTHRKLEVDIPFKFICIIKCCHNQKKNIYTIVICRGGKIAKQKENKN